MENGIRPLAIEDYEALVALWRRAGLKFKPQGRDSREALSRQLRQGRVTLLGAEKELHDQGIEVIAAFIEAENEPSLNLFQKEGDLLARESPRARPVVTFEVKPLPDGTEAQPNHPVQGRLSHTLGAAELERPPVAAHLA